MSDIHPSALCETTKIGPNTRVWAFAHILPGATIGDDCNICDYVFIENDVVVGNRVTIKCGVQLWDGLRIADDVFIGPNATFCNDKFPRSKMYQEKVPITVVEKGASLGANCTILPGITIGRDVMVGAGAVVTRSVPAKAIVVGNPAHIVGYTDAPAADEIQAATAPISKTVTRTLKVGGAQYMEFPDIRDLRGRLTVGNFQQEIPFTPKRYFMVYDVPSKDVRGEHAHKQCAQFLICVRGSAHVLLDDGKQREQITLNRPTHGLYMPPMIWSVQYKYSADAVLLVYASEYYDPDDYIRNYDEFILLANKS